MAEEEDISIYSPNVIEKPITVIKINPKGQSTSEVQKKQVKS